MLWRWPGRLVSVNFLHPGEPPPACQGSHTRDWLRAGPVLRRGIGGADRSASPSRACRQSHRRTRTFRKNIARKGKGERYNCVGTCRAIKHLPVCHRPGEHWFLVAVSILFFLIGFGAGKHLCDHIVDLQEWLPTSWKQTRGAKHGKKRRKLTYGISI